MKATKPPRGAIPVFRPSYDGRELEALREPFENGWIGLGPKTAEFEEQFAAYAGARFAVGMNSATAALHLAIAASGIGAGDEVLVPTLTFVSTAHAVAYCGAKPVFVDIHPETLCLDVEDARKKVSRKTRAIIPVHYGGHACPMEEVWELAAEHNLIVIEDAAHACGSRYQGHRIGGLEKTDATCFSFHAVKNLATGDGGMVTTNRSDLYERLLRLRWMGIDRTTWERSQVAESKGEGSTRAYASYGWYYEVAELGFKCHMNDITATIGLVQLAKLEGMNERRREIAAHYDKGLQALDWIERPVEREYTRSARHNYVIQTDTRDELNQFLKERGIATGVHYLPIHLQPFYRNAQHQSLLVAERTWTRLLTLPLYPDLSDEEVEYILASIRAFDEQHVRATSAAGRARARGV